MRGFLFARVYKSLSLSLVLALACSCYTAHALRPKSPLYSLIFCELVKPGNPSNLGVFAFVLARWFPWCLLCRERDGCETRRNSWDRPSIAFFCLPSNRVNCRIPRLIFSDFCLVGSLAKLLLARVVDFPGKPMHWPCCRALWFVAWLCSGSVCSDLCLALFCWLGALPSDLLSCSVLFCWSCLLFGCVVVVDWPACLASWLYGAGLFLPVLELTGTDSWIIESWGLNL